MKVSKILEDKGRNVFSIEPDATVYEALRIMGEKNIGALVILEQGKLTGIISERDYARKVVLQNKRSRETAVKDIMTSNVITVKPEDSIEHCMALMSNKKFRHLPVVEGDEVVGVLSISDIVRAIIDSQRETIQHLQSYITS
jgi:CBS domain-containing protein